MEYLRFDHFMQQALYHPTQGYYTKKINSVGQTGDFSTCATLSDTLAKAITGWIKQETKYHNFRNSIPIIELGAGTGKLAKEILDNLPYFFRKKVDFHIVETSESLKRLQQQQLKNKVSWHNSLIEALETTNGSAIIYSNEFVDAFPVRQFKYGKDKKNKLSIIKELYVNVKQRTFHFLPLHPPHDLPTSSYFNIKPAQNTCFEINQSYYHYLKGNLINRNKVSLLTIDYGDLDKALINQYKNGSLRGYSHHQLMQGEDLLKNIGHQDITADVNFSDCIYWAQDLDFHSSTLSVLYSFLEQFAKAAANKTTSENTFLTDPMGAGNAFKVLCQRHG